MENQPNWIELTGKVSKTSGLRYTPSGIALLECQFAVTQETFEKKSTGYFLVELQGKLAEDSLPLVRIGRRLKISGSLWMRNYRDRQGKVETEVKVIAKTVFEIKETKERASAKRTQTPAPIEEAK